MSPLEILFSRKKMFSICSRVLFFGVFLLAAVSADLGALKKPIKILSDDEMPEFDVGDRYRFEDGGGGGLTSHLYATRRWPGNEVPYEINEELFTQEEIDVIMSGRLLIPHRMIDTLSLKQLLMRSSFHDFAFI